MYSGSSRHDGRRIGPRLPYGIIDGVSLGLLIKGISANTLFLAKAYLIRND